MQILISNHLSKLFDLKADQTIQDTISPLVHVNFGEIFWQKMC